MKEFLIKLLRGAFTCVDDYMRMREWRKRYENARKIK